MVSREKVGVYHHILNILISTCTPYLCGLFSGKQNSDPISSESACKRRLAQPSHSGWMGEVVDSSRGWDGSHG